MQSHRVGIFIVFAFVRVDALQGIAIDKWNQTIGSVILRQAGNDLGIP